MSSFMVFFLSLSCYCSCTSLREERSTSPPSNSDTWYPSRTRSDGKATSFADALRNRSDKVFCLPETLSHCGGGTWEKLLFSHAISVVTNSWQSKLKSTQVLAGYLLVGSLGRCTRRFACYLWGIRRRHIPVIQTGREHHFTYVLFPARRGHGTFPMAYEVIKYAGAIYLIYLGVRTIL